MYKYELCMIRLLYGGCTTFKAAQNSFLFFSRLLELSTIFQAWNCTVWNDCAFFLR